MAAAGDIATGMLIGRAVEPHAGERGAGAEHGLCLNCGTALIGEFCHACGQNGHVHKTLASIGHDLLHGVFHFEGKVWRTLPMLIARPGALTRRYIDGERARFVSPLAAFLFFVFLMFAAIHMLGDEGGGDATNIAALNPAQRVAAVKRIDEKIARAKNDIAAIDTRRAAERAAGRDVAALDNRRAGLTETISGMNEARALIVSGMGVGALDPNVAIHTNWATLDHGIAKVRANPELALYKLQSSAYKYSWALIPISVPFVALLFLWRRRFGLYDHAIFVTYSLTFMLLLATVVTCLMLVGAPGWLYAGLILLAPPVHMFAQLRGAYGLRRFSALWRTAALLLFASITLTLFLLLLVGMGLMG